MPLVALTTRTPGRHRIAHAVDHRAGHVTGRRRDDDAGAAHRLARIAERPQVRGEPHARQEQRILVRAVDRLDDLRLVRPEPDRLALAGEQVGERGAPAPGAEHRDGAS